MWETICDAWACWSGWNFGPNSTEYPYSEIQNTPPPCKWKLSEILALWLFSFRIPPPPNENCQRSWHFDFSVSEYPPPPPENENCQRSWHFDFSVSEYPPPPRKLKFRQILTFQFQNTPPPPENLNLGRSSQWETMCGKLPHVETLSNPDNYSFSHLNGESDSI